MKPFQINKSKFIATEIITFLLLALLLNSCLKKEKPVEPYDRGETVTSQVSLSQDYRYQIWYSLENNNIVAQNLKTAWDIKFSCNQERAVLNTSRAMMVYYTGENDWSDVTDTTGFFANRKIDMSSGNLDSTAMGNIIENNGIYILDMGYDWAGQHLGFYKIQITSLDNNTYSFNYSEINDLTYKSSQISKDDNYHFVYFSLMESKQVNIEPPKEDYDLIFTQYTHIFYDPFTPYLVMGVLLNPSHLGSKVEGYDFENLSDDDLPYIQLTEAIDNIGYDWKEYSFETSTYQVFDDYTYVIKTPEEKFYKLRFLDFYDENGLKGAPLFAYHLI